MSTFALPRQSVVLPRRKTLSQQIEVGITAVLVVIGLVLSALSLSYLFYANKTATQDYHLRVLQEQRAELMTQSEVLEMQIANAESLRALQENTKINSMVAASQPLYISGASLTAQKEKEGETLSQ